MVELTLKWRWDTLVDAVQERCTEDERGCWVWINLRTQQPVLRYPHVWIEGKRWAAHRAVLHATTAVIGQVARHDCDNQACCNPDHLQWGTAWDNTRDAMSRGRTAHQTRDFKPNLKLAEGATEAILVASRAGETADVVAERHGVSRSRVQQITSAAGIHNPAKRRPKA